MRIENISEPNKSSKRKGYHHYDDVQEDLLIILCTVRCMPCSLPASAAQPPDPRAPKIPGSVGHKCGPKNGTVFRSRNWDRVKKWCMIWGPDSGHQKTWAARRGRTVSWLPRALCSHAGHGHPNRPAPPVSLMLPALGCPCARGLKT